MFNKLTIPLERAATPNEDEDAFDDKRESFSFQNTATQLYKFNN